MSIIEDGTGTGANLKIGSDNRLQARVVTEIEVIHAGESGNSYNFNSGLISVSGDATLMYVKNTSELQLVVADLAIAAFDGITYSDAPYITVVRNPTAGDLITDATAATMNQNRNFGSAAEAASLVYKGKTGGTCTGGNDIAILQTGKTGRSFFTMNFILSKGSSIAINLTANLSSGSANYYAALICYFKDELDI